MLTPLNDAILGEVIEHVQGDPELLSALESLPTDMGRAYEFDAAKRAMAAQLAPQKQPFQVRVVAVGPDVRDLAVGDIAILPEGGGTMITVVDDEDDSFQRVFLISEKGVLARFRED